MPPSCHRPRELASAAANELAEHVGVGCPRRTVRHGLPLDTFPKPAAGRGRSTTSGATVFFFKACVRLSTPRHAHTAIKQHGDVVSSCQTRAASGRNIASSRNQIDCQRRAQRENASPDRLPNAIYEASTRAQCRRKGASVHMADSAVRTVHGMGQNINDWCAHAMPETQNKRS